MNATFKARVRKLIEQAEELNNQIELLKEDFQEWIDEHDYDWENTSAGEKANDEMCDLDYISLEDIISDLEALIEPYK